MRYGEEWRTTRRYFRDHFHGSAVRRYRPIQLQEVRALLVRILNDSTLSRQHIRRCEHRSFVLCVSLILDRSLPGSTIMRVVYGAKDASQTASYVELADRALESARRMAVPGAFLAEALPVLKHFPTWLPGGNARRFAAKYKPIVQEMRNRPFDEVQNAFVCILRLSVMIPIFT